MSIKLGERERCPASRGKQGLEGQGSFRSRKEGRGAEAGWVRSWGRMLSAASAVPTGPGCETGMFLGVCQSRFPGDLVHTGWGPGPVGGQALLAVEITKGVRHPLGPGHPCPWMEISPPQEAVNPQPASFGGSLPLTLGGGWGGMRVGKCLSCSS